MRFPRLNRAISCTALTVMCGLATAYADNSYVQHNLISDIPGMADRTDTRLVNPWGIERTATSPWWVNAAENGISIVYDATGAPFPAASPIVVTIPGPGGMTSSPTAVMANPTQSFQVGINLPATFLFVTEEGSVAGWNRNVNATQAVVMVPSNGSAVYKGAALGQILGADVMYTANFHDARVDVYDGSFHLMALPAGAFRDNQLPSGYAPFNVQNIGGTIFVTYAKQDAQQHDDAPGAGFGYVDAYSQSGVLMMRLEHNKFLNAPWGIAMAPADFGKLSNLLLVGQFGSGQIATYDPHDGSFQGLMRGPRGQVVQIDGLWGLKFGNGGTAGPTNTLFFSAGIDDENHGLFGTLTSTKENDTDDDNSDHGDEDGNGNNDNGNHGNGNSGNGNKGEDGGHGKGGH